MQKIQQTQFLSFGTLSTENTPACVVWHLHPLYLQTLNQIKDKDKDSGNEAV